VHATYGPLFGKLDADAKAAQLAKLADKLTKLEAMLGSKPFLNGDKFTISDC
jgi:glutathione S-transferase